MNIRTKKIFVGGLSANLTEDDFKFYFEKFGRITDVVVMHDNVTHRPCRFGFITFETEDLVEDVMQKNCVVRHSSKLRTDPRIRVVIQLMVMGARFHLGSRGAHCRCQFIQLT